MEPCDRVVLVTGGAGFIGRRLVRELLDAGSQVVVFDNLNPQVHGKDASWPRALAESRTGGRLQLIRGDVTDYLAVQHALLDVTHVVHLAAEVGVGQGQYEIARYTRVNVLGTAILMQAVAEAVALDRELGKRQTIQSVFVAGSMSAYGEGAGDCGRCGPVAGGLRSPEAMGTGAWDATCPRCSRFTVPRPTSEDVALAPRGIYARTKADTEGYALDVGEAHKIPVFVGRFFNCYGPGQSQSNPYTGLAAILTGAWRSGAIPTIYEDGEQVRDFIHVDDLVAGITTLMSASPEHAGVYNIGTGIPTSVNRVAGIVREALIKSARGAMPFPRPRVTRSFRSGDIRACFADVQKLRSLGWEPKITVAEGLAALVQETQSVKPAASAVYDGAHLELRARGLA